MTYPDATFLDYAAEVKRRVGIPVIAVGRLGDPAMAERAVAQGKADFIALGRTLIADPQWAEKVRRGEPIRRCLACNTCINDARRRSHWLRGQRRRWTRDNVHRAASAPWRAHRGHRRRSGRPDLCVAGRRG
ncbi:MAG TPA: hypothetical protein VGV62_09490 [Xanthobacteraceae bacterium]|nr:hypothetical protein [Xanthobacteraceae bacterium]